MEVIETSLSGVPLLRISGDVDHSTVLEIDEAVRRALDLDSCHVFLDLTDCRYLDSGCLAVVLSVVAKVESEGWVGVIGARANILRLFEIVGLMTRRGFRVLADADEAVAVLVGTR